MSRTFNTFHPKSYYDENNVWHSAWKRNTGKWFHYRHHGIIGKKFHYFNEYRKLANPPSWFTNMLCTKPERKQFHKKIRNLLKATTWDQVEEFEDLLEGSRKNADWDWT